MSNHGNSENSKRTTVYIPIPPALCQVCGVKDNITKLDLFLMGEGMLQLCQACRRDLIEYIRAKINLRARIESCIRKEAEKWQTKC